MKKMKLAEIKVRSFATELSKKDREKVAGGFMGNPMSLPICPNNPTAG